MLAESIVLELCQSGALEQNVEKVNAELGTRCETLVNSLRARLPEAKFVVPEGGYFLWLELEDDVDTAALLAEAKAEGVTFVAGPDFMGSESSLRLSFAPVTVDQIDEGVARLATALERTRTASPAKA